MTETATAAEEATTPDNALLMTLTDEEIAVLGGADSIGILPIWTNLTEVERKTAARAAFRGLIARGFVEMPTDESLASHELAAPGSDLQVEIREDVHSVMTLRKSATAIVAVARTASGGQDYLYAHCVADVALLEEVGNQGLHRFALGAAAGVGDFLLGSVLHPDAADGTGEPVTVQAGSESPARLVDVLGEAHLRSDVIFRRLGDSAVPLLGFFSGPQGTWLVRADHGEDQLVEATPITVEDARRTLVELGQAAAGFAAANTPDDGAG